MNSCCSADCLYNFIKIYISANVSVFLVHTKLDAMKKNLPGLLFFIVSLTGLNLHAQTFNGTGGSIPDYNGSFAVPTYFPCVVSGLPSTINSTFGLERICLTITHTYDGDLEIKLMSPDSFIVMLSNRHGGADDNYVSTCFRGHGANGLISSASNIPPYTGEFDPDGDIATYNNGRNPNGTWYLIVTDLAGVDTGSVNSFQLTFSNNPTPVPLFPCSTTDATMCQCPDGTQDCDLLPDMTAAAAALANGSFESNDTIYVNNATPNIGWGPLEIHGTNSCFCDTLQVPCSTVSCPGSGLPPKQMVEQTVYHKTNGTISVWTRPAGTMTYHPSHGHIHLDNWASYTLRKSMYGLSPVDWPVIGQGAKQSYCLINLGLCTTGNGYCVDSNNIVLGQANIPNAGMGSVTGCATDQGIFVGNFDVYSAALNGQWIVLDSVCNGNYYLVSITDPLNVILETNENNNWAAVPFPLTHQLSLPFPSVNFSFSGSANTITFTNTTTDYDSVRWDFGDGFTDTAFNPVHSYAGTGLYHVVLTAYNRCGFEQHVESFTITLLGIYSSATSDVFSFNVYPNPSTNLVKADFSLSRRSSVRLQLFDAFGKLVQTLVDETMNAGSHQYVVDASKMNLSKGVYNIRLVSPESNMTRRIVFIK